MFTKVCGFELYIGLEPISFFNVSIHLGNLSLECQRSPTSWSGVRPNSQAMHGCTDRKAVSCNQCGSHSWSRHAGTSPSHPSLCGKPRQMSQASYWRRPGSYTSQWQQEHWLARNSQPTQTTRVEPDQKGSWSNQQAPHPVATNNWRWTTNWNPTIFIVWLNYAPWVRWSSTHLIITYHGYQVMAVRLPITTVNTSSTSLVGSSLLQVLMCQWLKSWRLTFTFKVSPTQPSTVSSQHSQQLWSSAIDQKR